MNKLNHFRRMVENKNPGTVINELVNLDALGHPGLAIACMANLSETYVVLLDQEFNPVSRQHPLWKLVTNLPPLRLYGIDGSMRHVALDFYRKPFSDIALRLIIRQSDDGIYYLSDAVNDYNSTVQQSHQSNRN